MATSDLKIEPLSGLVKGRTTRLNGQHAWNDLFIAHHIVSTTAAHAVWLRLFNASGDYVEVAVVTQPATESTQADVDAATVKVSVPPKDWLQVFDGAPLRRRTATTPTFAVACYLVGGLSDDDKILVSGHIVIYEQTEVASP